MTIARGTAAPSELRLGDGTFRLKPLNYAAIGEYEQWCQDAYIAQIERLIGNLEPEDARQARIDAVKLASKLTMTTDDPEASATMSRLSSSLEGGTRLMWLSMRAEQADLTLERVGDLLADPAALGQALDHFNRLNEGPEDAPGKPKRPARTRKKKSR